jgi:hypothetical protein
MAVEAGVPHERDDEKMVITVATQKANEASLMARVAGPPVMKVSRRGETPVAAKKAVGAPPTVGEAGATPGEMIRQRRDPWPLRRQLKHR